MNNRIIYAPVSKFREVAREALRGNWARVFWGMLIYYLFSTIVENVLNYFFAYVKVVDLAGYEYGLVINYAGSLYTLLVMGPLNYGLILYLFAYFRDRQINYPLTLEGFSFFGRTFSLYLQYSIRVFLWSLLFGIPGVVAMMRYSMCFYLRVDHPDWTSRQCIVESTRMMRGNKWKIFCLQFSFIGWTFLALLPSTLLDSTDIYGFSYLVLNAVAGLPGLLVTTYSEMAILAFYEVLVGNLRLIDERAGVQPGGWNDRR